MNTIHKVIILSFLVMALASCNTFAPKPTETLAPTETSLPTSTFTPEPTSTPTPLPTSTATVVPTETSIPQPALLTGTIFLSSDDTKPFISLIELRQKDSFTLIGKSETNSNGMYKIEDIDPGTYELWVLITTKAKMISGCGDIAPPDNKWKIGIKFGDDKALSMENAYLSKALLLSENLQTSELKAQGFFAVLEGFKIESGMENRMDVTLICK